MTDDSAVTAAELDELKKRRRARGPYHHWHNAIALAALRRKRDEARASPSTRLHVYCIEEDEMTIRLSVGRVEVAAHPHDTPEGCALLKIAAARVPSAPAYPPAERRHGVYTMPDGSKWHSGTGEVTPALAAAPTTGETT